MAKVEVPKYNGTRSFLQFLVAKHSLQPHHSLSYENWSKRHGEKHNRLQISRRRTPAAVNWPLKWDPQVFKVGCVCCISQCWLIHFSLLIMGQWLKLIFGDFIYCNKGVVYFAAVPNIVLKCFHHWNSGRGTEKTWLSCLPSRWYGFWALLVRVFLCRSRCTASKAFSNRTLKVARRDEELALPTNAHPYQTKIVTLM